MAHRLWKAGLLFMFMHLLYSVAPAQEPSVGPPVNGTLTIPADTIVYSTINTPLNSGTAQIGQQVTAMTSPQDLSGLPQGTQLHGYVSDVHRVSTTQPGMVGVRWYSATLPDNEVVPIDGVTTSLAPEYTYRMPGGRVVARSNPDGYTYYQGQDGYAPTREGSSNVLPHNFWGYTAAGAVLGPTVLHTNVLTGALLGGLGDYVFSRTGRQGRHNIADLGGQLTLVAENHDQPYMDAVVPRDMPIGVGIRQPLIYRYQESYRYPNNMEVLNNPQFVGPSPEDYPNMAVTVDGRSVIYTAPLQPANINGLPYIPLAPTLALAGLPPVQRLGPNMMEFQAPFGAGTGWAYLGQPYVTVGDRRFDTGTAPLFVNGQVYVTPAFMNSVYGYNSVWDRDHMRLDLERSDHD